MEQLAEKIKQWIGVAIIAAFFIVFALLILPIIPFFLIYSYFSDKQFHTRYNLFLEQMNGALFFCYNSRKSSVDFARESIIPELDPAVQVVFVDGREVILVENREYVSRMLGSIKERKGFPYLLKVEDGQVLALSVNNQFYNILNGRKAIAPLLDRINTFFNTEAALQ